MSAANTFGGFAFGLRTSNFGLFADTWHLIPDTSFSRCFVFFNIPGVTFNFEVQETGVWSQNVRARLPV